jgi:hypothetical protein
MARFDVFNGDADGLCALQQLRLAEPADATRVTGAKRDIALLDRVDAGAGDEVTVLDVSVHANRDALARLLAAGARVRWFDHHHAGAPPSHPAFEAHLDADPRVCTALIVDRHLGHRFAPWAVAGAFGDNLDASAHALADAVGIDPLHRPVLRTLGQALNHNAYGDEPSDLLVHPAELFALLAPYADPLAFASAEAVYGRLVHALHDDLVRARACTPLLRADRAEVIVLPDAAWARRVRGTLGNALVADAPTRAHAIAVPRADGGFTVSVRVPAGSQPSADAFCRGYPGGGGRAIAAGIDRLPDARLEAMARSFMDTYRRPDGAAPPADA